jgi:negative regulator of flagellin synthesis FlgM
MKIVGSPPAAGALPAPLRVESAASVGAAEPVQRAAAAPALASSVLQPARAALQALPEIDVAKVQSLRDALARGEIRFDPERVARLIQRFHGGRE